MTAVLASNQPQHDRADQLKQLRRQMAAVSGKVGSSRGGHVHTPTTVDDLLPGSEARLPVPQLLADVTSASNCGTGSLASEPGSRSSTVVGVWTWPPRDEPTFPDTAAICRRSCFS